MQYWKNLTSGKVFGYDISDPSQIEAMNDCLANGLWEDVTSSWPPQFVPSAEYNKIEAIYFLSKTDWVNQPDVYDPANSPHLLNRQEFLTYRAWVRNIAVNPIEGNLDWPTEPKAIWS